MNFISNLLRLTGIPLCIHSMKFTIRKQAITCILLHKKTARISGIWIHEYCCSQQAILKQGKEILKGLQILWFAKLNDLKFAFKNFQSLNQPAVVVNLAQMIIEMSYKMQQHKFCAYYFPMFFQREIFLKIFFR